jgi:phosphatidylserine/phosphatidylglycerophosphate/cardiolipin synthase-like enzyme
MNSYALVSNLSLIVQPGDSFFPLVTAIDSASKSIKMTIFRMDDPVVRDAMRRAVGRGVKVQVLVAPESKGWNKRNRKLGDELAELGIEVTSPAPSKRGTRRYHYKVMVVDFAQTLILTFNPTKKNLHYARDFGLVIKDATIAAEIDRLFEADWRGEEFVASDLPLVVSPDNSRERIMELLESASRSILILDAKVWDKNVLKLLAEKAEQGCDVRIIGSVADHPGADRLKVARSALYKLHSKCVVVDGLFTFIGSQNLRKSSLDRRRELGIIIEDEAISRKIERIFEEDWSAAEQSLLQTPA